MGGGLIEIKAQGKNVAIVEVKCESTLVAQEARFKDLVTKVLDGALVDCTTDVEVLRANDAEEIQQTGGILGERIQITRFATLEGDTVGFYRYPNGKSGAIVSGSGGSAELFNQIAMQVANLREQCSSRPSGRRKEELKKSSYLLSQASVLEPNSTVGELVEAAGAEITAFVYYGLGDSSDKVAEYSFVSLL